MASYAGREGVYAQRSPINGGSITGPRTDEEDDDLHIERVLFFASLAELAPDAAAMRSPPNSAKKGRR